MKLTNIIRPLIISLGYLVAFVALDLASTEFQTARGVSVWYPPDGLTFSLFLMFGARYAPLAILGSLFSSLFVYGFDHIILRDLLIWAIALSLWYASAASFLRRILKIDLRLATLRDMLWLIVVSILVAIPPAFVSISFLQASGEIAVQSSMRAMFQWWIGESIGLLVITPFVLTIVAPPVHAFLDGTNFKFNPRHLMKRLKRRQAMLAHITVYIVTMWLVFLSGISLEFGLYYLCFIPLLFSAFRYGLRGATLMTLAINSGATAILAVQGYRVVMVETLQVFMLVLAITGLFVGAGVSVRQVAEATAKWRAEQQAAITVLGSVLAETLAIDEIYERFYRAVVSLLPDSETVFISLYDEERSLLSCAFAMSEGERLNAAELPPIPLEPPGVGTQSEAVHTRRPVIVNDLQTRLKKVRVKINVGDEGKLPQSGLYVPMLSKERVIGVVQTQSLLLDRYTPEDGELLTLVANTAAVAIENAGLYEQTTAQLSNLQALREIDIAISSSLDLQLTLAIFVQQALTALSAEAATVLLLDPHTMRLTFHAGKGFRHSRVQQMHLRMSEGVTAGLAAKERRIISLADLSLVQEQSDHLNLLRAEGFVTYHAAPLIAKGEVKGVLEIFHRAPFNPTKDWLDFLEALAAQAAIAIDNATLFDKLQRSNVELSLAYDATIEGWSRAMDLRDEETEGHTQRVTEMTQKLARLSGLREDELVHVKRGALLHDIGKLGVPDSILLKVDTLTDEEWVSMRRHPQYAYDLLSSIAYLRPALDIPYCHHEKWDGTGYPRGLKGEQIPLTARLFAVVDVWDALRSDRRYRPAWPKEKALEHIHSLVGTHFDPKAVEIFMRVINEQASEQM